MGNIRSLSKLFLVLFALSSSTIFAQQANTSTSKAPSSSSYKAKTKKLDRAEVDAWLSKPDQVLFIDVRRPDELASIGGLPVYLNIQLAELEKNLAFITKDRTIVTLSNHAGRAGAAADLLASKGFKVGGAVGVQNYEEQGGKLSKPSNVASKISSSSTN